jgi:hypothetical protein
VPKIRKAAEAEGVIRAEDVPVFDVLVGVLQSRAAHVSQDEIRAFLLHRIREDVDLRVRATRVAPQDAYSTLLLHYRRVLRSLGRLKPERDFYRDGDLPESRASAEAVDAFLRWARFACARLRASFPAAAVFPETATGGSARIAAPAAQRLGEVINPLFSELGDDELLPAFRAGLTEACNADRNILGAWLLWLSSDRAAAELVVTLEFERRSPESVNAFLERIAGLPGPQCAVVVAEKRPAAPPFFRRPGS